MDIKQLVAVFNSIATTIKAVADTPGLSMIPYAATISSAIGALQTAVNAGVNIVPYVTAISKTFSGEVPTQAQLDDLDAEIKRLESLVDAPLPPREDNEPE